MEIQHTAAPEAGKDYPRNWGEFLDWFATEEACRGYRVASLIKRWILGTHHGSVQPAHLDAYLDEFVFRFNRRTSTSRGLLFYRLLQQAVLTDPVTCDDVVRRLPKDEKAA